MKHLLDIHTWCRKDHFDFFNKFDEPFFGICAEVDCTQAYHSAKENEQSFFLTYLYKSLVSANTIEAFRYRIIDGQVWVYDQVHAGPTIHRPDKTFGYGYINYEEDFDMFYLNAKLEINRIQNNQGLEPAIAGENVIHYSTLPWIRFTALSHARCFSFSGGIPKITFGQLTTSQGRKIMPVSIHVHHGLMDGWDVGQYLEHFQQLLNRE